MPPVFFPFAQPIVPATAPRVTDDFVYRSSPATYKVHWLNAGGISYSVQATANNSQFGLIQYGVNTVGQKGGLISGTPLGFPAPALLLFQANLQLDTLSAGSNRFQVQVGLFDNTLDSASGYGFRYQDNINGGKWLCFGDTGASFDSNEGAVAAPESNKFRIWCFGPNSPVIYMVNDRIVGTLLSPLLPGTQWCAVTIEKVAGVGLRNMTLDYAGIYWTRPDLTF